LSHNAKFILSIIFGNNFMGSRDYKNIFYSEISYHKKIIKYINMI